MNTNDANALLPINTNLSANDANYILDEQDLWSIIKINAFGNDGSGMVAGYGLTNACSTLMFI